MRCLNNYLICFQIDSQNEKCIGEIDCPMTFDLVCKVLEILDSKEDATAGGKVLRVTDATKCPLALISVAG